MNLASLAGLGFLLEPQTALGRWRYLITNFSPHSGGAFELIQPGLQILAVILSARVLAGARHRGFPWYIVILWTVGVLLWPQIGLPLYLAFLLWRAPTPGSIKPPYRFVLPLTYLLLCGVWLGWGFYRRYYTLEAYLSRAQQYSILTWHNQSAQELRQALTLEESPHTRNLLGQELAAAGHPEEAIAEFRRAQQNGEPDELLPLRLALALDVTNHTDEAAAEYRRFLQSPYCASGVGERCEAARGRLAAGKK